MPRLEFQLFLWVTAVALVALGIFRGSSPIPPVLFDEVDADSASTVSIADDRMPMVLALGNSPSVDEAFLGSGSRPIFLEPAIAPALADIDVVITPMRVLPVLKGIISSGRELRAVFASSPDAYVVVGLGDRVAEFTITGISNDEVLARDELGRSQGFPLRGTGEN